ncbi:MAG: hypothetical protein DMG86_11645 [Acidobacteria bacterium]|nr:MAG: hypothetical protein DMG86_11645 [Acidobacteriota bacterium]
MDRETLEAERRVFGPEHRETLITTGYLADALVRENRYSDAETLRVQVLAISRRVFGPESPDTLAAMESLGVTLSYEKQYAKAENLFQESIQVAQSSSEKQVLAAAWYRFACGAAVAGHRDRALAYLGKAADLGWSGVAQIATDEDLRSLHGDPRFTALIAKAKTQAAAQAAN